MPNKHRAVMKVNKVEEWDETLHGGSAGPSVPSGNQQSVSKDMGDNIQYNQHRYQNPIPVTDSRATVPYYK